MCGRFTLTSDLSKLQLRFSFAGADLSVRPHYNVAPTQEVLVVRADESGRQAELMQWGLVPSWSKAPSSGYKMINARAETAAERPTFRNALRHRRCLVLADGFYEWKRTNGGGPPMYFSLVSGQPFAFAGLWEEWVSPQGAVLRSCSILTTQANSLVAPVHDRMPVILHPDAEDIWLDRQVQDPAQLTALFAPFPAEEMQVHPVSTLVNSPRHDDPQCIQPVNMLL